MTKVAALASNRSSAPSSSAAMWNTSQRPGSQRLDRARIVTWAMNTGYSAAKRAASPCSTAVDSNPSPTPTWSWRPSPTGSRRDRAAAQEDRGRAVRARGDHHGARPDLAALGRQPHRPAALDEHPVDERLGPDCEICPRPRWIEVREPRVPAGRAVARSRCGRSRRRRPRPRTRGARARPPPRRTAEARRPPPRGRGTARPRGGPSRVPTPRSPPACPITTMQALWVEQPPITRAPSSIGPRRPSPSSGRTSASAGRAGRPARRRTSTGRSRGPPRRGRRGGRVLREPRRQRAPGGAPSDDGHVDLTRRAYDPGEANVRSAVRAGQDARGLRSRGGSTHVALTGHEGVVRARVRQRRRPRRSWPGRRSRRASTCSSRRRPARARRSRRSSWDSIA